MQDDQGVQEFGRCHAILVNREAERELVFLDEKWFR